MAQTVIGLDIGTWSIKAAVLESTLRKFAVVDFVEHHIPRDPSGHPVEAEMSASLRATLREFKDWDSMITAAPGKQVLTREVELPFTDDKRIRSVLGFQLEDQLPVDIEDLIWDYYRLDEDDEGVKLLCPAIPRGYLVHYLQELADAGADPKVVTLDTLAYAHLVQHLDEFEEDQSVALVDIGHTSTSVSVVQGGRARTVRSIARGGHQITAALMEGLDVDYGEAERLKHQAARLDGGISDGVDADLAARVRDIVERALQPIFRDVRLTLHAHANRSQRPLDHVLLFGGTSRIPGLDQVLGEMLGAPIRPTSIRTQSWAQFRVDPAAEPSMPKAMALALRFLDEGRSETIDFRQGELAHESDFKAVRDRAGWLAMMAVILVLGFLGKQYVTYQGLESNHEALARQLEAYSGQVLGDERQDFDFVLQQVSRPPAAEAEEIFPEISAFKAFYDLTGAQAAVNSMSPGAAQGGGGGEAAGRDDPAPPRGRGGIPGAPPALGGGDEGSYQVELQQIEVDLKNAYVKGEANNIESVEAFTTRLESQRCFKTVETTDTTRISFGNRQDWLRFQLKIDIGCEAPAEADAKSGAGEES